MKPLTDEEHHGEPTRQAAIEHMKSSKKKDWASSALALPTGSAIQTEEYTLLDGQRICVEYDPHAPCRLCGLPVIGASMGGTDVCSWCDCGVDRTGRRLAYRELMRQNLSQQNSSDHPRDQSP